MRLTTLPVFTESKFCASGTACGSCRGKSAAAWYERWAKQYTFPDGWTCPKNLPMGWTAPKPEPRPEAGPVQRAAPKPATPVRVSVAQAAHGAKQRAKTALGIGRADVATIERRLAICDACPHLTTINPTVAGVALGEQVGCELCGCAKLAKVLNASERCPINKWGPVTTAPTTVTPAHLAIGKGIAWTFPK